MKDDIYGSHLPQKIKNVKNSAKEKVEGGVFAEERALYGISHTSVLNCRFEGEEDGESALKETFGIFVKGCTFKLRYPLWHTENTVLEDSEMTETARAALWYGKNISIGGCKLSGVKAVRECKSVIIDNCEIVSAEFGWLNDHLLIKKSSVTSEYPFLHTANLVLSDSKLSGKYSFQYVKNAEITNCELNTKDAFWHSKNVTVRDSVLNGEYLGWYSDGLTLINCKIRGTQPLCYCSNLKLINCEMHDCDLSFEYSDVDAEVTTVIDSVKNPASGVICAPGYGEIILTGSVIESRAKIEKV